jgi:hypothetical protein
LEDDPKEEEHDFEEVDPTIRLISFLKYGCSVRVEVLCYNGSLKADPLIDWI